MPTPTPWWIARVNALLAPADLTGLDVGALFRLCESLEFVRQNVDPALRALDHAARPESAATWASFVVRQADALLCLQRAGDAVAHQMRGGTFGHAAFRAHFQGLGFTRHLDSAGSPADDFLDGMLQVSSLAGDEALAPHANLNLPSRAERVSDFLTATGPSAHDVVFDLGSGSGKLALTVAASCAARVHGIELVPAYVGQARQSAAWLGLANASFEAGDACAADLSKGSIFYLYFPFSGPVAHTVAGRLGALAREREITVYCAGPNRDFGEHFLSEVEGGALSVLERRGEFDEVLLLHSA